MLLGGLAGLQLNLLEWFPVRCNWVDVRCLTVHATKGLTISHCAVSLKLTAPQCAQYTVVGFLVRATGFQQRPSAFTAEEVVVEGD